jgi:Domain of unknown function (DUF1707)/Inner membrane component of T3SS, cytoplasmic domain
MAGSADMPATPEFLRASDAERDHAVAELRNEFAQGRLSHETFLVRMQTALDARNRGELARLFTDLPPRRTGLPERIRAAWRRLLRQQPGNAAADPRGGIAAVTGFPDRQQARRSGASYWPPDGHGSRVPPGPQAIPGPRPQPPAEPAPLYFPPGSGTRFTIGRTHDCDLRLTDLSVSRLHAELTRGEDGWMLCDLGSHNGTRLNGWLVREQVPVRAGDRVEFGSAAFIMKDGSAIES